MRAQVTVSYITLPEAVQDIFLQQRTGVLTVRSGSRKESFVFLAGQLYLQGTNPFRDRMEAILAGPPERREDPHFNPESFLEEGLAQLVRDLADEMRSWSATDLRFDVWVGEMPEDLHGPVPTGALVMDLYSRGQSVADLMRRLGGSSAKLVATEDQRRRLRVPDLQAEEVQLLDRLEEAARVESLLEETDTEPRTRLTDLVRLLSVGLIGVRDELEDGRRSAFSQQLLDRISERVAESLEREPLEMDESSHQALVDKMLREYGRLGFYDLLEVEFGASTEEVHAAFMEVARLAHPSHAARLGMRARARKLELLFARLTEAYLVLSDPERGKQYRQGAGFVSTVKMKEVPEESRRSERKVLARQYYRMALEHAEEDDFFYAIELLKQALVVNERPEYYAALGRCQRENPKWLHMAVDSLRRAVTLRPESAEYRSELTAVTERLKAQRKAAEEHAAGSPKGKEGAEQSMSPGFLSRLKRDKR